MPSSYIPTPLAEQREIAIKQFRAGICLIENSGLLQFDRTSFTFQALPEKSFEDKAKKLDKNFGRVMYWVWFSTGAEYLLKGFMIVQDPAFLMRTEKAVALREADDPRSPQWIDDVLSNQGATKLQDVFSTMKVAYQLDTRLLTTGIMNGLPPSLDEARRTKAAYLLLKDAIRNRDSHAYVEDVRKSHYHMIHHFAPAFDTLLAAAGAKQLLSDQEPL